MKINGKELDSIYVPTSIAMPVAGSLINRIEKSEAYGVKISAQQWKVEYSQHKTTKLLSNKTNFNTSEIGVSYGSQTMTLTIMVCCIPYTVLNAVIGQIVSECTGESLYELENQEHNFLGVLTSYDVKEFQNGRKYKLILKVEGWKVGDLRTETFEINSMDWEKQSHSLICNGNMISPLRIKMDVKWISGTFEIEGICRNPVTGTDSMFRIDPAPVGYQWFYVSDNSIYAPFTPNNSDSISGKNRVGVEGWCDLNADYSDVKIMIVADGIDGATYTRLTKSGSLSTWDGDVIESDSENVVMIGSLGGFVNNLVKITQTGAISLKPGENVFTTMQYIVGEDEVEGQLEMTVTAEWYDVYA